MRCCNSIDISFSKLEKHSYASEALDQNKKKKKNDENKNIMLQFGILFMSHLLDLCLLFRVNRTNFLG